METDGTRLEYDIMIAAHAEALGVRPVTNNAAIKNLKIDGLKVAPEIRQR